MPGLQAFVSVLSVVYTRYSLRADRVLYPPERVATLGQQSAQENSPFLVTDRIGLISDTMVLGKSGLTKTSAGLALIDALKASKECQLCLQGIFFR